MASRYRWYLPLFPPFSIHRNVLLIYVFLAAPSHNNLRHATRVLAFTLLNLSVETLRTTNAAQDGMTHLQQLVSWMRDLSVGSREVEEVLMTFVWVWAPVVRCVEFMVPFIPFPSSLQYIICIDTRKTNE